MLGKDYMLAIIIVNYDDNIWNDPSLDLDSDLPSGWRTIRDSTGTYYWHVATGATQWQHPSYSTEEDPNSINGITAADIKSLEAGGRRESRARLTQSPLASINDRVSWQDDYFCTNIDPDSKCFAVRSLGWVEIPEEELIPGKSSLAVNNCIQQLSSSKAEGRDDTLGAWGEGQDMMMVLKKDTLSLMDPVDRSLLHCQPITDIRVWGVGCNNGRDRDFAFVASDKDTCMLKCHVFRCKAPAKTIATALHKMCSKIMAEKTTRSPSMARSLTMATISPEDLPRQVDFVDAMRQRVQKFEVQYIGNLPVSRAMGMEVLNRAIESIMNTSDSNDWEPIVIHISDSVLSLWKGEDGDDPFWECQVRLLTFLGVGHDTHTFAVIVDGGTQRFECHVFWCEPDAGIISEAVQAACMVQYQKCLVAQTPPPRSKMWRAGSKVKRANSMDGFSFPAPRHQGLSPPKAGSSTTKKGMLAFFETFRNKQSAVSTP
ncbi:amyloid-beta A4 precursor protein-binding family B member 3 isoform X1 [Oncorhynchus mykiss]|uniref:amyloid-beta A4 precursor protein-binding family B member 3 isoform X1 n=1 Tax=Oncorhynchus mykiss TaxID=8022 RepID=UPI000B4F1918|nr:amyloid-beta A4 precursor protein-binding family B member 3 isoform X1 [Oncorhynchus mykiss]